MIIITCPNNNVPERTYSVDVIFRDILGLTSNQYKILFSNDLNDFYQIDINGYIIRIEDHFFRFHKAPLSYISTDSIPSGLQYFHAFDMEVPMLYGEDKFIQKENLFCVGLDIFASTFFMLTRWEEILLGREENGDCDEEQLFAVKYNIYKRPIVNEYETILSKLLSLCGFELPHRDYEVTLTHDVDGINTPTWSNILKTLIKRLLGKYRTSITNLSWRQQLKYKLLFPTCFSQFELYRDIARKYNIPEWFYLKVCAKGEVEATYLFNDSNLLKLVKCLQKEDDVYLGFHPSQTTFNNHDQWKKELHRIHQLIGDNFSIGRNHHLLYNYLTLGAWEEDTSKTTSPDEFKISNCVFHKRLGFRSGVAVPYFLFDIYNRREMALKEYPCQIMDSAIRRAKYTSNIDIENDIEFIVNQCKKYSGHLLLTWHIYIRKVELIEEYYQWCTKTIKLAT